MPDDAMEKAMVDPHSSVHGLLLLLHLLLRHPLRLLLRHPLRLLQLHSNHGRKRMRRRRGEGGNR